MKKTVLVFSFFLCFFNIFADEERAILLSQVLLILNKRNSNTIFNYFSPFISDVDNLKLKYSSIEVDAQKITESLKVEKFYIFNEDNDYKLKLFDQFLNKQFDIDINNTESLSTIDFLLKFGGNKNGFRQNQRDYRRNKGSHGP